MALSYTTLTDATYSYEVELVLDGQRYVATASWPQDQIEGNEPSVALDFTPDPPSLNIEGDHPSS